MSSTWSWQKMYRGLAYRVKNAAWTPDVFAAVVDDYGNLVTVAWWCE